MPNNLLVSDGGIKLPGEVCLQIAQEVIDIDPRDARTLMLVSKVRLGYQTIPHN